MIFIKGTPEEPKCGFTRRALELLRSVNADFSSFDILSDEQVRQGLKEYSNWPTYPQIYLDGELIGGLDVFSEEMTDKKFVEKLPKLTVDNASPAVFRGENSFTQFNYLRSGKFARAERTVASSFTCAYCVCLASRAL
ncbi:unnamed protein product [Toxocara canis]|uniref:Glutaredoxin domain-containing protein n=1 Tax=Toxocara canis TaxID=6265 RepID=A0A183U2Q9_TOXCA|nr:unnamed protein product [Toxocara canis]